MTKEKVIEIPIEFKRLFDHDWREAAIYGGRYSLKSHTVARYLLIRARQDKTRVGCFREFQNSIAESSHQLLSDLIKEYEMDDFKVTDKEIINTVTGSEFIFKGLHRNEQNIKSTEGIDIAWVEEAQTVSQKSIEILTPTIRKEGAQIIYTYNRLEEEDPVHKRLVLEGRPNTLVIEVNYFIAEEYGFLPEAIKLEIEDDKTHRPELYKHKWLGAPEMLSEERIYKGWNIIEEIPPEARLERHGVDFGYYPDPAAIVDVYYYNGGYILDQRLYQLETGNRELADTLKNLEPALTIADSAEPKSIAEIKLFGVNIVPTKKGADSVRHGIKAVQDQKISVTSSSVDLINEYRKYSWKRDKEGKLMPGVPDPSCADHCFSGYTLVHTTKGAVEIKELVGKSGFLYSQQGSIQRFHSVRPTRKDAEVLTLHLNDDTKLTVTPDHLLLRTDGLWQEARLFNPTDMIQSGMYGQGNSVLQGAKVYLTQRRKIFEQWAVSYAQVCLGVLQRAYSPRYACSSRGRQSFEQPNRKPRDEERGRPLTSTHDRGAKGEGQGTYQQYPALGSQVARVKRGQGVAQVTWEEYVGEAETYTEILRSLPYKLYNATFRHFALLRAKLQDEGQTKTITRITRGREAVVYNMEVEGTHCLLANGVVAHNCMDASRYAINSLVPVMNKKEMVENIHVPQFIRQQAHNNPAR